MIEFAGIKFKNPFVVASSPLTSTIDRLEAADRAGGGRGQYETDLYQAALLWQASHV